MLVVLKPAALRVIPGKMQGEDRLFLHNTSYKLKTGTKVTFGFCQSSSHFVVEITEAT
jgi:hypothetical protein